MSLFAALMGDIDDDPFMGGHMRRMNSMMNSFFRDPFSDMMGRSMGTELMPHAGAREGRGREVARYDNFGMGFPMMGMGFPNLRMMLNDMGNNSNCHSFSSSTVMTMSAGPDGRPQVYQASQSVKQGPGGVRETKKTVADSRTGVKKMSIGHHIHDRAHIIEREQNVYSGDHEERQDFINLDEEEAETFNKEWEQKTRNLMRNNAIEYGKNSRRRGAREPQLALPSTQTHNSSRYSGRPSVRRAGSSHPALPSSSAHTTGPSERKEGARVDEHSRKRKISEEVEEVDEISDEEDTPKQKHQKVHVQHREKSPSPSKSSSSE